MVVNSDFFGTRNFVLNITDEKHSFSISTTRHWSSKRGAEIFHKQQELSELRSQKGIELHVEEVRKRRNQIKIGEKEYKLTDLHTHKNEIIDNLKNVEFNDIEDMVFGMGLTYSQVEKKPDTKYIQTSSIRYTQPPGLFANSDIITMIKSLLSHEVKAKN